MRSIALVALLLSSAFAAEYLVGVGKDETTGCVQSLSPFERVVDVEAGYRKKGIGFDPSVIHPVAGDVVAFEFRSGAHSAVRMSLYSVPFFLPAWLTMGLR